VLCGELLGLSAPHLLFDVVVHVATLAATLLFYRREVAQMVAQTWQALLALPSQRSLSAVLAARPDARLFLLICIGTVPTGLVGVLFKDQLEALFAAPRAAAGMLLVTAALLLVTRFVPAGRRDAGGLTVWHALAIGLAQGFAIVPGISRSGTTIAIALLLGVERELAARFSFLLSVPAILGALVLKLGDGEQLALEPAQLGIGFAAAAISGLVALALLIPLVRGGRLHYFAAYLVPAAVAGLWLL